MTEKTSAEKRRVKIQSLEGADAGRHCLNEASKGRKKRRLGRRPHRERKGPGREFCTQRQEGMKGMVAEAKGTSGDTSRQEKGARRPGKVRVEFCWSKNW